MYHRRGHLPTPRATVMLEPAAKDSDICIRQFILLGIDVDPIHLANYKTQPNILPQGTANTISIHLVAILGRLEIGMLVHCVQGGEAWCLIEWTFLGTECPVFTTRHALVEEETSGVGFSGGLGWASLELPSTQEEEELAALGEDSPDRCESPPQASCPETATDFAEPSWFDASWPTPFSPPHTIRSDSPFAFDLQEYTRDDSTPSFAPQYPLPLPRPESDLDFFSSANQAWTPAETLPDADDYTDMGTDVHEKEFPEGMADHITSMGATGLPMSRYKDPEPQDERLCYNEARADDDVQKQIHLEIFRQRQLEAEALYARNGDPSLLLAVSRDAATYEWAWRPSGLSLF